jgi:N-acetylneuraminic acid mutarotase
MNGDGSSTCMISVGDEHIYLIGGVCENYDEVDSVWRYEISTDSWTAMPKLNRARYFTNACTLDGILYVFGGRIGQKQQTINSFEMLNLRSLAKGYAVWQIYQLSEPTPLTPRSSSVVIPMNSEELVIIGGRNKKGFNLSDVLVYNIKTRRAVTILDRGPFTFYAGKTQTAFTNVGKVVKLVWPEDEDEVSISLIQYESGESTFKSIKNITYDELNSSSEGGSNY